MYVSDKNMDLIIFVNIVQDASNPSPLLLLLLCIDIVKVPGSVFILLSASALSHTNNKHESHNRTLH